jgi:hypothetical protein
MLTRSILRALAPCVFLFGCGGGGDDDSNAGAPSGLAGVYQTTSDTRAEPCDAGPMPVTAVDPPYFQIKDENAFGAVYVAVYPCTGSDASTCDSQGFAIVDFATAASAGTFRSEETSLSTDGSAAPTNCSGNFTVGEIKKTTGGVTVTTTEQSGTITGADLCKLSQGDFTAQQTAAIKALPCASQEMRVGMPL